MARKIVAPQDRTVVTNGLRLHYLDWGNQNAPTMLLVHGGSSHAHIWDLVAPAFAADHHIVAVDLRGHGDSGWAPDGSYDRAAYVSDLKALVDAEHLTPLLAVGHSMGANALLGYAAQYPRDIRALVMIDSGPGLPDEAYQRADRVRAGNPMEGTFEEFVQRVRHYSPHWPDSQVEAEVRHSLRPLPDGRWTWKGDPQLRDPERRSERRGQQDPNDAWASWKNVQCPTLIVRGESSRIFPKETAERLHQSRPDSHLVEIPNAGHRVPQDNPATFTRALSAFLATVH